jgi:hypothetical protein
MKTLKNKLTIAVLSASVILGSCSKQFITKAPDDQLLASQALAAPSDLVTALNGVYAQLAPAAFYGRDLPVIGDLMADNTYVEQKNSNRYIPQYKYTVLVTDGIANDAWTDGYKIVLRANNIIDAKVTGSTVVGMKAQAYALRALAYFKMVTLFGKNYTTDSASFGVPLIIHYSPFFLPARNSVGQVYAQIVSDLKTAMATAPQFTSSVFISKYAIEGLLAKVYMYMGDYTDAKSAAADVINNSGFTLVSPANYAGFWADPSIKTDKVEVMFEVNEDVLNNNGFDDLGGIYINGYTDIYCSNQLFALYSATDVRTQVLIPDTTTKNGATAIMVAKYPNAGSADRDNPKVLRLSEVYLVGAEAAARTSDETTAKTWLNKLMANRDPAFAGYTSTGAQLISDIIQERRKELAFEGDRFFDLNRLGQAVNRSANPGAIPGVILTIPFADTRRLAPIPNNEIQANPTIAPQQNSGY